MQITTTIQRLGVIEHFSDLDVDLDDNGEEEEEGEGSAVSTTAKSGPKALSFRGEDLKSFIDWPESSYWGGFIRLKNNS